MEMKKCLQRAIGICGAVIGAGFATGQEIVSFFSMSGGWSWLGIAVAVLLIGGLGQALIRTAARGRTAELAQLCMPAWQMPCRLMFGCLTACTGGAMLAGAAELAALIFPWMHAALLGWIATLGIGVLMSFRQEGNLSRLSGVLLVLLLTLMAVCWRFPSQLAAVLRTRPPQLLPAAARALCWGGMNLAIAAPLLCQEHDVRVPVAAAGLLLVLLLLGNGLMLRNPGVWGSELPLIALAPLLCQEHDVRVPVAAAGLLLVLLLLGNGLMLRNPGVWGSELPLIALLAQLGRPGQLLGAAALYVAMLTTLLACLRGLRSMLPEHRDVPGLFLPPLLIALLSLVGFRGMVGKVYPALGAACLFILCTALHTAEKTGQA